MKYIKLSKTIINKLLLLKGSEIKMYIYMLTLANNNLVLFPIRERKILSDLSDISINTINISLTSLIEIGLLN